MTIEECMCVVYFRKIFFHEPSAVKIMQSHAAKGLIISFFDTLLLCSWCMAYRNGPLAASCERFHVSHGSNARNINENVTILLHKVDGTQIFCIQPSQEYTGAQTYCNLHVGYRPGNNFSCSPIASM